MCVATVFAVGVLVGLVAWIMFWKMFPILCCFLLPSVCGDCVCSGGSCGTCGLDFVLEDVLLCCFLLPSVCGDCVCSGGSSGTAGLDCVLEDVSNTMLFSVS